MPLAVSPEPNHQLDDRQLAHWRPGRAEAVLDDPLGTETPVFGFAFLGPEATGEEGSLAGDHDEGRVAGRVPTVTGQFV
jgi:hypothetical protein